MKVNIELLNDDEIETWKWVMENFNIFNQARKVKLGRIILDVDREGKIKTKYEIPGEGLVLLFNK